MSPQIAWPEIALRLLLTAAAGALIGLNREEHGRSAGLRTTMLVCLAASLSMIQANLLLTVGGKTPGSFAVMDLMRLPLGILTGMGFIGAGAIMKRDNLVTGVTTAATLWFSTMMGLCFGGGQIGLGLAALALGFFILSALKGLEKSLSRSQHGILTLTFEGPDFSPEEVSRQISAAGGKISSWSDANLAEKGASRIQSCSVVWKKPKDRIEPPAFLNSLAETPRINRVEWRITGNGSS